MTDVTATNASKLVADNSPPWHPNVPAPLLNVANDEAETHVVRNLVGHESKHAIKPFVQVAIVLLVSGGFGNVDSRGGPLRESFPVKSQ